MTSMWDSHNHGPNEGRGLDCPEKPIGQCIRDAKDAELAKLRAEVEGARAARDVWLESSRKWKPRAEAAEEALERIRAALDGDS